MNGRLQDDGSIIFPMRGDPPVCNLEGYIQDPEDAFRWIMLYCPCKHRELKKRFICSSGKVRHKDYCNHLQLVINPAYCNQCQVSDK